MNIYKKIRLSVIFALIVSVLFSNITFAAGCEKVRDNVLRLHILAQSDSEDDQRLKLKVRDRLLQESGNIFDGSVTIENAVKKITPEIPRLKAEAEKVIAENGYDYNVNITLEKEFFKTRTYEKTTLPAGKYLALKVIIGSGKGHNWWCVMFPALCLPAAAANNDVEAILGKNGKRLVSKNPKYEPRFKIVEIIEKYRNKS